VCRCFDLQKRGHREGDTRLIKVGAVEIGVIFTTASTTPIKISVRTRVVRL